MKLISTSLGLAREVSGCGGAVVRAIGRKPGPPQSRGDDFQERRGEPDA